MSDTFCPDAMPRLIQAGMGIRVSSSRLANETSRLGALGVVSSVGLRHIVIEEIRSGDPFALAMAQHFPITRYRNELLEFAPGGRRNGHAVPIDVPDHTRGAWPRRLSAIAAFVEVARAKQGHRGKVGINVMWKCALTALPSIYGAMLAGLDALLCGAGVPMELPDIVARMRTGQDLAYDPLHGTGSRVRFDIAEDQTAEFLSALPSPHLIPILSNFAFPKRIVDVWEREHNGARPFAFVLENHAAGGHNAPPRARTAYGPQDEIDSYFDRVLALDVPIYVAGAFNGGGSAEDYAQWRERGAYGIQVGSRFALCNESGMRRDIKDAAIASNIAARDGLQTDFRVSPTGYPFKVVPLEGTLADPDVYASRKRLCDKGYLLQSRMQTMPDGAEIERYVCPAMPVDQYERFGGDVADTVGRMCLCNGLLATVGFDADREPAVVTLGASGEQVTTALSARDIVTDIMGPKYVCQATRALVPEFME